MRDFREKMAGFEFDLISGLGGENHSLTVESSVLYYKKTITAAISEAAVRYACEDREI